MHTHFFPNSLSIGEGQKAGKGGLQGLGGKPGTSLFCASPEGGGLISWAQGGVGK